MQNMVAKPIFLFLGDGMTNDNEKLQKQDDTITFKQYGWYVKN